MKYIRVKYFFIIYLEMFIYIDVRYLNLGGGGLLKLEFKVNFFLIVICGFFYI